MSRKEPTARSKYTLYVVIASFFWGTSFPAISYALRFISPAQLLFSRFFLATILAVALFPRSFINALKKKDLVFVGSLNGFAYLFQFLGQKWVPAGITSILVNTYTLFAPIFAYYILKESVTPRKIMAASIGLLGVVFITNFWNEPVTTNYSYYLLGLILVFGAGLIWGLYVTFAKAVQLRIGEQNEYHEGTLQAKSEKRESIDLDIFVASMFYTMIIAFFALLLDRNPLKTMIKPIPLLAALYLAVFCSIIPFTLYLASLDKIPISASSILLLFEVIVSFFISITYLGETVTWEHFLGSIIIGLGIYLGVTVSDEKTM